MAGVERAHRGHEPAAAQVGSLQFGGVFDDAHGRGSLLRKLENPILTDTDSALPTPSKPYDETWSQQGVARGGGSARPITTF